MNEQDVLTNLIWFRARLDDISRAASTGNMQEVRNALHSVDEAVHEAIETYIDATEEELGL